MVVLTVGKLGYEAFFANIGDYDLHGAPMSWTKVVAMRHALTKYPDASYMWYLDQDALIMNPKVSLHKDILGSSKLDELMLRQQPVALPDSIIKTFRYLKAEQVNLVLTQDDDGIAPESMVVRNGDWARFLLDTWYDPLYRSYNFQLAEVHALVSSGHAPFPSSLVNVD
jgi:mannan polymerase II complex MNN11 subunit